MANYFIQEALREKEATRKVCSGEDVEEKTAGGEPEYSTQERMHGSMFRGKSVIELGSGTGVVSIAYVFSLRFFFLFSHNQ